jgi:aminopeptidase N
MDIAVQYKVIRTKLGLYFIGPDRGYPKKPVQVWTQGEDEYARYWFPCHDSPHAKVTSELRVRVARGFRAVSNGILISHDVAARSEVWHWRMDKPHSIYLITLVVGQFSEISTEWDGLPIIYYCTPGREDDARRGFSKTAKAIEFFSTKTGVRYPYPRYAQIAVAEYPGGMEHTTCTTQTDACLIDQRASADHDLDTLVAHELAHQWFGDLVTCSEWPHAWLNEGFATYFEVLFQHHDKGPEEADYELLQNARAYFDEDSRRYRRPIVCRTFVDPWTIFDRHLYEKGSWVLHMLRHELGDDLWWKCIGHYLRKHENSSVQTQDLVVAIEEASGRNMQSFFDQWIYRSGYPVLRIRWSYSPQSRKGSLWILQTQPISDQQPAFQFTAHIRVSGSGWTKDFHENISAKEHRFSWVLPGEPLNVEFDPNFLLLKKVSFHKPLAMWFHQLSHSTSAIERSIAATSIANWGGLKAIKALSAQILREKFWGAAVEIIHCLATIPGAQVDHSLRTLLTQIKHPKVLRSIIAELSRRGTTGIDKTLSTFARNHRYLGVQAESTKGLGKLGLPHLLSIALTNLKKTSYRDVLSASSVAALAATRDPKYIPLLKKACEAPSVYGVRVTAARALADFSSYDKSLVPWLCERVSDLDERITLSNVAAIGSTEDERALPTLKRLSKKAANPRVRVYALEAIARISAGGKKAEIK